MEWYSLVIPIFSSLRILHTDFHSGCTSLWPHQQWMRTPFSGHPLQHLSAVFLTLVILAEVRGNLRVLLIYTFLITEDVSHFYFFSWELSAQICSPFFKKISLYLGWHSHIWTALPGPLVTDTELDSKEKWVCLVLAKGLASRATVLHWATTLTAKYLVC